MSSRKAKQSPKKRTPKRKSYFKSGNNLTENNRKYCRCVYHVAAKQSHQCLSSQNWGGKCYNPYSVCTASTKRRGKVNCFENTNLSRLPEKELQALAALKRTTPSALASKKNKK